MKFSYLLTALIIVVNCATAPAMAQVFYPPKSTDSTPEQIFKNNCAVCHGDNGDGNSRASSSLIPPPRNFTIAGDLTREKMIFTVTNGKPGTAMTSWKTRFTPAQIEGVVDYVRGRFMQTAIQSQLTFGRMVYGHNCQLCHGDKGQGVLAKDLTVAPRDLALAFAVGDLNHARLREIISRGIPHTAMPAFSGKIPDEQINAVIDFLRDEYKAITPPPTVPPSAPVANIPVDMNLPMPKNLVGNPQWGGEFFMNNCSVCHGTLGNGQGPRSTFMVTKPRNFLDELSRTTLNRPAIFSAVTLGSVGTEMPAWGQVLSEQEIANLTEFVFQNFIQKKSAP